MNIPLEARAALDVRVETDGNISPGTAESARAKVTAALEDVREPVFSARVRLGRARNPAADRPVSAQASVDVNGRVARAHVFAATETEAVDWLRDRLVRQLERLRRDHGARRDKTPGSAPVTQRGEPPHRPTPLPLPPHEREIVRHKSFSLARATPDEAAFEMDVMDYDFHLFTDLGSGEDSVIYRAGPTGLRLAQVRPRPDLLGPLAIQLTVSPIPAPCLRAADAKLRLDATGDPFVFFSDAATGRGNVLYLRSDGHYGLITPAC